MKQVVIAFILGSTLLLFGSLKTPQFLLEREAPVAEVLKQLGDKTITHYPDMSIPGISAEKGKDLVLTGFSSGKDGQKVKKQSKHFVCTSCHNVVKEDPDLRVSDPQARLLYADENGLPFLQGTSLYGAVNRTSFYNGDYEKKYGDLVVPARNDIREAIQLCAVECSQGRALKDWELESVLAYLWTIDLKISDLNISTVDYDFINRALAGAEDKAEAAKRLKSFYLDGSPATFVTPPSNRKTGYVEKGDAKNGKLVYDLSCKHCHEDKRYSFFNLDDSAYSFNYLKRHMARYTRYSVYQVTRYGTPPMNGKKAYMPNYTLEKLSNQQLEDLRAYIEQQAR